MTGGSRTGERLAVVWDVRTADPRLFDRACAGEPALASLLDEVVESCPIAPTVHPFEEGVLVRPTGHVRSFSRLLPSGATLVIKGTEPLAPDHATLLDRASSARTPHGFSPPEQFLLWDGKVYLGLTLPAARACADITLAWTQRYAQALGRLPRTPFPLLVLRVPRARSAAFEEASLKRLSDRRQASARKRFTELMAGDLAVYVYYYPSLAVRAAHAFGSFPHCFGVVEPRPLARPFEFDPDAAVESWLALVGEMLALGYLPTTTIHTCVCVHWHNLVVDGGLCDVDSIEDMRHIGGDRLFLESVVHSLAIFSKAIERVVIGEGRMMNELVNVAVWRQVMDLAKKTADEHDLALDPRLGKLAKMSPINLLRWTAELLDPDATGER